MRIQPVLFQAQTHAFTVLGMSQLMHAVGMRDVNKSIFQMDHVGNPYMLLAWGAGISLQVLVTEVPYFVSLFGTSRLSLSEWLTLGALSCMPLLVHELLVLSEALQRRAGTSGLKEAAEGKNHENSSPQPGEAV